MSAADLSALWRICKECFPPSLGTATRPLLTFQDQTYRSFV